MAATRAFYEDVIGLPLVRPGANPTGCSAGSALMCTRFFGLADGSALAFFQFADAPDAEEFSPPIPETLFHHIALKVDKLLQQAIEQRIAAAGYGEPQTFVLDHGYRRSLYIRDPNGLLPEFTLDLPGAELIAHERQTDARATLERWLAGDHASNNCYRGNTI